MPRKFAVALVSGISCACLAAGAETNTPAPLLSGAARTIDPAAYESLVRENLDLRAENARVRQESERLRRDNAGLVLQLRDLEQKQENLTATLRDLRTPDDVKRDVERLRQDRVFLVSEIARLYLQIQRSQRGTNAAPSSVLQSPRPGTDLFRQLEKENQDLRAESAKLRQARQEESAARAELARQAQELSAALEQRTAESAQLHKDLAQLQSGRERERAAVRKLAERLVECLDENKTLREAAAGAKKSAAHGTPAATAPGGAVQTASVGAAAGTSRRSADILAAGLKLIEQHRYREAVTLYEKALNGSADDVSLHYNLGVLYEDYLKDPRNAAVQYRKYLELSPSAPDRDLVRSWLIELDLQSH